MQGLEAVVWLLTLQGAWDFWMDVAELSMVQSSQHELCSTIHVEFWLVSVHSSCIVICSVDKSDTFGWIVVHHKTGFANGNVAQWSWWFEFCQDELALCDTNQQSASEGTEEQQFYHEGRWLECKQLCKSCSHCWIVWFIEDEHQLVDGCWWSQSPGRNCYHQWEWFCQCSESHYRVSRNGMMA
jgi:hypothetical protein